MMDAMVAGGVHRDEQGLRDVLADMPSITSRVTSRSRALPPLVPVGRISDEPNGY
jgi:hypothetical protein